MPPIPDHPLRSRLADELHARPFPVMAAPGTVVFLAFKLPGPDATPEPVDPLAHLGALLHRHGAARPRPGATHHSARIGDHTLKWERHTEFVTYTAHRDGLTDPVFDACAFDVFPDDWLATAPGTRITSLAIAVAERPDTGRITAALDDWFIADSVAASRILDDNAVIASDFHIDPGGHMRFAVFASPGTGQRRIGRIVQRLCEIETYKAMSMLGYFRAGDVAAQIGGLETRLSALMVAMTGTAAAAEETLHRLLEISGELELLATSRAFRFAATRAYEAIVTQRIAVLREERFEGRQTFDEFMTRRFDPSMRTVQATETRLRNLADRAMRAGDLLRTRVDVRRSEQNRALLASMDRRADLALRLQHTVEGLSVVAISYYAVSLAGYALYPLAQLSGIGKGMMTAAITVPVVALVWWSVRRIRRRLERKDTASPPPG
jgi:uncharacterized membrane-anchored protein